MLNLLKTGLQEVSLKTEAKSSKARMNKFSKGTAVEVSSDEDGFQGAWFTATVINARGQDKYLVEYKSLRTEDDTDYLREEVDIQHVRPRPPNAVMIDSFDLNEEVEAFCNDGWWEGVISKVVKGSRYKVYFKGTKDEVEFQHSDLRPRQDWIEGTWVRASQVHDFEIPSLKILPMNFISFFPLSCCCRFRLGRWKLGLSIVKKKHWNLIENGCESF